jgi:hypothetical protein
VIHKAWIPAQVRGAQVVGLMRAVFVFLLAFAIIVPAVAPQAGHELSRLDVHMLATDADPGQSDDLCTDREFDCSIHPGCNALQFAAPTLLPVVAKASVVPPEARMQLPGIFGPPISRPPNLS